MSNFQKLEDVPLQVLEEEIQRRRRREPPSPLSIFDTSRLQRLCGEYIKQRLNPKERIIKDPEYMIFEEAMSTFYGPDIWPWLNSLEE